MNIKRVADDPRIWPFNKKFYLILNLAYGGSWGGYDGVDDSKLPHRFLIDYVRVYQLQEGDGPFSLNINPATGGTVEITPKLDSYPEGTEITLTAVPDTNFQFKAWKNQSRANPYTFILRKDMEFQPQFSPKGEMLSNGQFDENRNSWSFYVNNETIKYASTVEDGIFVTDVIHSPNSDWQLGFQELGLAMKKGKYLLRFDAKADQQKQLLITVSKNYSDWSTHISKWVSISSSMENYELVLDMPRDDENTRLYFGIGNFTGKFYIDNISLTRVEENITASALPLITENDIKIFPNPSSHSFKIQMPHSDFNHEYQIKIFSTFGKLMDEKQIQHNEIDINTSSMERGIYLVNVLSGNKSWIKKVIIE